MIRRLTGRLPERWYRDVWMFGLSLLVYLSLSGQGDQVDRVDRVSSDTAKLARRTAELARSIQAQRVNSVLTNCQDQNTRHDNTLTKLDAVIDGMPEGPDKARAKANQPSTVILIDALVPKRDCRKVLDDALTPAPDRALQDPAFDDPVHP